MSPSRAIVAPSLALGLLLVGAGCRPAQTPAADPANEPSRVAAGPTSPAGEPAASPRPVPDRQRRNRLVGWWLRHDQGYMMILDEIGADGRVEARYLNPRSIHVSKAEVWTEDGGTRLLVELTDENYPGNYYELAYDSERDLWIGLYHHLGNDEVYEVYFFRFEDESNDSR